VTATSPGRESERGRLSRMRRAVAASMNLRAQISVERTVKPAKADELHAARGDIGGMGTALEQGVVSHAIVRADEDLLEDIALERRRTGALAADHRLTPADLSSAMVSIPNPPPFGTDRFQARVIPPQAAILASGQMSGTAASRRIVLTLCSDRQLLDAGPAAQFPRHTCEFLKVPGWIADDKRGVAGESATLRQGPNR
jgi:pyruvate dehydrogenase E2 component (dihydrolipoamide acetyltransferase)